MSYNEFRSAVAKELEKYGYTKSEIAKYIAKPKTDKVMRLNYKEYSEKKTAGSEPTATASCLDMMYE